MPARRDLHTGRLNFLHRSWGPLEPFDNAFPALLGAHGVHTHLVTDHLHYFEDGMQQVTLADVKGKPTLISVVPSLDTPVCATQTKKFNDEKTDCLVLQMAHGELTLSVPAEKAEEVGMRWPISGEDVDDLFEVLQRRDVREPANWSRRFKNHQEKLKSGDVYQVAEVVRNLSLRDQAKGLSAGEKRMLAKARQIHYKMFPLFQAMFFDTNPVPAKTTLALMGKIKAANPRMPIYKMNEAALERMKKVITEYGLI